MRTLGSLGRSAAADLAVAAAAELPPVELPAPAAAGGVLEDAAPVAASDCVLVVAAASAKCEPAMNQYTVSHG